VPVEFFLDIVLVTVKQIHGPVKMMQLDILTLREVDILSQPLLIAAELG